MNDVEWTRKREEARVMPPETASIMPKPENLKEDEGFLVAQNEPKQLTLPCAVKILIKSLRKLELAHMDLTCDLTIILWVGLNGINNKRRRDLVYQHIMNGDLKFRINEREHFVSEFRPNIVKPKTDDPNREQTFALTMRGTFVIPFYTNSAIDCLKLFPFDLMPIRIKFELTSFQVEDEHEHYKVRHDLHNRTGYALEQLLSLKSDADKLPEYLVAIQKTSVHFEPEVKKTKKDGDLKYYPTMIMTIFLYRDPGYVLLSIVLPLLIINFITALTGIKDATTVGSNCTHLSMIVFSIFGCMLCGRQRLPPLSHITFVDKLVGCSLGMVLCSGVVDLHIAFQRKQGVPSSDIHVSWLKTFLLWDVCILIVVITKCIKFYASDQPSYMGKPPFHLRLIDFIFGSKTSERTTNEASRLMDVKVTTSNTLSAKDMCRGGTHSAVGGFEEEKKKESMHPKASDTEKKKK